MDQVSLHLVDLIIFATYMVATMALGFWVARDRPVVDR